MATTNSLENKLVVLIGGTGFIGSHVAQELLDRGARLRIAGRNPEKAFKLKPLAKLGQLQFVRCDVMSKASVEACVEGADAVVYVVGTFGKNQQELQADGAGYAARKAAAGGASGFVYVSAIGADPDKDTGYYRTKGDGERQVLEAFPKATVVRPSAVAGEDAGLIPMFGQMVQLMPVIPVFGAGSKLQPVWVDDLAKGIANALAEPAKHGGKIYEAAGPDAMTMSEIYSTIADAQQRKRTLLPMPDAVAKIVAMVPFSPMNEDQLAMLQQGSTATPGAAQLDKLGVETHPMSLFMDRWMMRYRKHGRFTTRRDDA